MFDSKGVVVRRRGSRAAESAPAGSLAKAGRYLLVALLAIGAAHAQDYRFTTVAGGFTGDGGPATQANVGQPVGLAFDALGNLYVSEASRHRIRRITPGGVITTIAGTGAAGYQANIAKAGMAPLNGPLSLVLDAVGNIYFSDSNNNRVRKITPGGNIVTVAGNGSALSTGDGGSAINAGIARPYGLAFDATGNLYVAESLSHRIRRITPAGAISTFAGNGVGAYAGDGGPATSASFREPAGLAFDGAGNLYVADSRNHRVRMVAPDGMTSTIAGAGVRGLTLYYPYGVAVHPDGALYIGDGSCRLHRIASDGTVSAPAGGGGAGDCTSNGDGGPAFYADIGAIEGIAFDAAGNVYAADGENYRIRKLYNSWPWSISTYAGMGSLRDGTAKDAVFSMSTGLGMGPAGELYLADTYYNQRVRKITTSAVVTTLAGNGDSYSGSSGDGGPAPLAALLYPTDAAVDPAGNTYIVSHIGNRIRKVNAADGTITTVAGGVRGFGGDGGSATAAKLDRPIGIAVDAAGNFYIADQNNHRVRKVTPGGIITTIAGNGVNAFAGDGGPAMEASISSPHSVAVDAAGNVFIADYGNLRVRKVTPGGVISTVAGSGAFGYGGDGGTATAAELTRPTGIAVDAGGNLFIAGGALRKVGTDGKISTINGLTHSAYDVAVGNDGALYVSVLGGRVLKGTLPGVPTRKPF